MTTEEQNKDEGLSFLGHLDELRAHLLRACVAILVMTTLAFLNKDFIYNTIILAPKGSDFFTNKVLSQLAELTNLPFFEINTGSFELINITMSGQLMSHIWMSLVVGLITAAPYFIWEIWRFIKPALHDNELRQARGAAFFLSILFSIGVLFGYYIISPLSINFLSSYSISPDVHNQIKLSSYVSLVSSTTLASALVFELPIVVYFFSKIGVLTPKIMIKYRKHAYVVLLILSAIITPPDVFSQILICIPLVILYEIGIIISKRVEKVRDN